LLLVLVLALNGGVVASAQDSSVEKAAQITADAARRQAEEARRRATEDDAKLKAMYPLTPLAVQVVVSRYQGDKKVSSLPYALSVNANSLRWGGRPSQLRMGADIPVPAGTPPQTAGGKPIPMPMSVSYKAVGTNIDATADSLEGGRFRLNISVEDSSVYADDSTVVEGATRVKGMPVFRSFRSSNELILSNGQSAQFTAAADRVSGEVIKVEVTLSVAK